MKAKEIKRRMEVLGQLRARLNAWRKSYEVQPMTSAEVADLVFLTKWNERRKGRGHVKG